MKTRFEAEVELMPKVDQNVPLPRQSGGKWGQLLASMKAGDSFVVNTNAERNTAMQAAARTGTNVTSRKLDGTGIRIWKLGSCESSEPAR